MKKKIFFLINCLLPLSPVQADVSLWDQVTYYTFTNQTQEPMTVAWQSGGAEESVLTGRRGSFELGALKSNTIQTSGRDCLDVVTVTAATTAQKASLESVCNKEIIIKYTGDAKDQKLVLEVKI